MLDFLSLYSTLFYVGRFIHCYILVYKGCRPPPHCYQMCSFISISLFTASLCFSVFSHLSSLAPDFYFSYECNNSGENWNVSEEKRGHWQFASPRTKREIKWGKEENGIRADDEGNVYRRSWERWSIVLQKAEVSNSDSIKEQIGIKTIKTSAFIPGLSNLHVCSVYLLFRKTGRMPPPPTLSYQLLPL